MTDQQINIAVAEVCGFVPNGNGGWHKNGRFYTYEGEAEDVECVGIGGGYVPALPKYCSDLNAMDEALKILSYKQQPIYLDILTRKVLMKDEGVSSWDRHTATARQRAEAFLRTLNLWRDDTTERKETK